MKPARKHLPVKYLLKNFHSSQSLATTTTTTESKSLSQLFTSNTKPNNIPPNTNNPFTQFSHLLHQRKFNSAKTLLRSLTTTDPDLSTSPFPSIASSLLSSCASAKAFPFKAFDMLFTVDSDGSLVERSLETFDFMAETFNLVNPRSCSVCLQAPRKARGAHEALAFFRRMVGANRVVDATVYATAIVVDGLCKSGDLEKKGDLGSVELALREIDEKGIGCNIATYSLLVNVFSRRGDIEQAYRAFEAARKKG